MTYREESIEGVVTDEPRRVPGLVRRIWHHNVVIGEDYGHTVWGRRETDKIDEAQLVSSKMLGSPGRHAPVLDIDYDAELVPSSTPGHYHLYLDVEIPWRKYRRFLKAAARAGVLEKGYVKASIRRRHTAVRVPWLRKAKSDWDF